MKSKPAILGGYVIVIDAMYLSANLDDDPLWDQIDALLPSYSQEYVPATGVHAITITKDETKNVNKLIKQINDILLTRETQED